MISGSRLPTLLITGANGFIGSAIIAPLIQGKGWDRCIFLVRAPSREDGLAKLAHSLRKHAVAEEALNRLRLGQILCGDLTYVPDWKNDPRLSYIIDVVNCAAVASFSNHPSIWPTNVDGVVSLAKVLHERCRLRRFFHLGTRRNWYLKATMRDPLPNISCSTLKANTRQRGGCEPNYADCR